MESRPSDAPDCLMRLRGSAQSIAFGLAQCALPPETRALGAYLDALRQTLILARASRANSAASLARVRAAARFQTHRQLTADGIGLCQDFAVPAETGRESPVTLPVSSNT